MGDRSLLPSWSLAQVIQPHHRVAIGGDGGDELFLGYARYLKIAPYLKSAGKRYNWASLYWKNCLAVGDLDAISIADRQVGQQPMKLLLEQMRILQSEYEHSQLSFYRY